jgi:hypothetical protein
VATVILFPTNFLPALATYERQLSRLKSLSHRVAGKLRNQQTKPK